MTIQVLTLDATDEANLKSEKADINVSLSKSNVVWEGTRVDVNVSI